MGTSKPRMTSATVSVLRELLADPTKTRYGYELMKRTGLPSGTLYPILARLERAGWLESFFEDIDPEEGRPPRRHYRLTRDGLDQARLDQVRGRRVRRLVRAPAR
ncbi:PadR family transcriptional regulator [Actinomadura sp. 9N215]|uniref:PadR family transcriptional regulator n=1 Tax=Actinomadura sp. 9N215 TaxID=3375150 RepID=UPI00379E663F